MGVRKKAKIDVQQQRNKNFGVGAATIYASNPAKDSQMRSW